MTTYPTPHPVDVSIQALVGEVRITASDRDDTVVEILPSNELNPADMAAADHLRVQHTDGRIEIHTPTSWKLRLVGPSSKSGSVIITVDLPTGSRVEGDLAMGTFHTNGELGRSQFRTGMGDVRLDQVGPLLLTTGYGDLQVDTVLGDAELKTGSGRIRVGAVTGGALLRNANGSSEIESVGGDLRVKAANGDVHVGRAQASATVRTANGRIRIDEIGRGVVAAETGAGSVEVGVREGTAAWLDLASQSGDVRNGLEPSAAPTATDDTVELRVRTGYGDVVIHRSATTETRHS